MSKIILSAALVLLGTLGYADSAKSGIHFQSLTFTQALSKAKTENKLVFVDVYTSWCGPCKWLSSEVFTDDGVGTFYNTEFVSIKIDAENGEGPKLAEQFGVHVYPTLLFLNAAGEVVSKKEGAGGPEQVLNWGNVAVHPEQSVRYLMGKELEADPSSKNLMAAYIRAQVNDGVDPEKTLESYRQQYPDLDLRDPDDFLVFSLTDYDLKDPLIDLFLSDVRMIQEQNPGTVEEKMKAILLGGVATAIAKRDKAYVAKLVERVYPAYYDTFGDDGSLEEAELLKRLEELYDQGK